MKKTKIVCTIGPASENKEMLKSLIQAGMNVMRLNFSHGDHEEHMEKVNTLRELNAELGTNVAFMLDTKGPEIRTGVYKDDQKITLEKGQKFTLTTRDIEGDNTIVSVTYKQLVEDVTVGSHILVDDGLVDLLVEAIEGTEIHCTVLNAGTLKGKRGVNVPGAKLQLKAMTDKDIADITLAATENFDYIAASFVRKASDVVEIRQLLNSLGNTTTKIISKIENQEGLDNFEEILKVTDGIMVARGDLGVEIPAETLPAVQKMMIKKTVAAGKPVITATQMLESMQKNPRPTRAEVSDVANAVYDGTSAVMLSGESAQGDYPFEAVSTMAKIAIDAENHIDYWKRFKKKNIERLTSTIEEVITDDEEFKKRGSYAVCCNAMFANADAIIAVTEHGTTPSLIASYKPACPVYAITANRQTFRQVAVEFGVHSVLIENEYNFETILNKGIENLKEQGLLKEGNTVILSGCFPEDAKLNFFTNQATGTIIKL